MPQRMVPGQWHGEDWKEAQEHSGGAHLKADMEGIYKSCLNNWIYEPQQNQQTVGEEGQEWGRDQHNDGGQWARDGGQPVKVWFEGTKNKNYGGKQKQREKKE